MKPTIVIRVPIQSAIDDTLIDRVADKLRSGDGDVVFFGVTRAVGKAKKRRDSVDSGPMKVEIER